MSAYQEAYQRLNTAQRHVVDTIDGPLLVLAGPGTGKTQTLAMRVGKILEATDTGPESILCISFTDAAVQELRQRLVRLLGPTGDKVTIHTFHSFGRTVINDYPVYFNDQRSLRQLDDIGQFAIYDELLRSLPYRHPFGAEDEHHNLLQLSAVQYAVRALKQAALDNTTLLSIIKHNAATYQPIEDVLQPLFGVSRLSIKQLPAFSAAVQQLEALSAPDVAAGYPSLATVMAHSLAQAVDQAETDNKTTALGAWRTKRLARQDGIFVLKSRLKHPDLEALAEVYRLYQQHLTKAGLYDYEDMILTVLDAIKNSEDLRLSLSERYLFVMVDEYQDTNGAQNHLIEQLSGNEQGNEQPNVMVVGDDDQAIMRFQGAEISNMLAFVNTFRLDASRIVSLTDNYRSQPQILQASREIITQTNDRLEISLSALRVSKQLQARTAVATSSVQHLVFDTPLDEYAWLANDIQSRINAGETLQGIGVIAPRHQLLIDLVPFLNQNHVPISYERREHILDQPTIRELITTCRLVSALAKNNLVLANSLLPEVLSYSFWGIPAAARLQLAIQTQAQHISWLEGMMQGEGLRGVGEFLLAIKDWVHVEPFQKVIDGLIGSIEVPGTTLRYSPLKKHYFKNQAGAGLELSYAQLLSHLSVLRDRVQAHFSATRFGLDDFLQFIGLHERSGLKMIDASPLLHNAAAIQLMTAHGAKGREFKTVYIIGATDNNWGPSARGYSGRIYLPENLTIYPAGNTNEDKLRLLFVAMTRAKQDLILSSHRQTLSGSFTKTLSFLDLPENTWATAVAGPEQPQAMRVALIELDWRSSYVVPESTLKEYLAPRLEKYQLSPSHIRDFLDVTRGGPKQFLLSRLLRFPVAKNFASSFGTATHWMLQQAQLAVNAGARPTLTQCYKWFDEALKSEPLSDDETTKAMDHVRQVLPVFYQNSIRHLRAGDAAEITINRQLGEARLTGKLDSVRFVPNTFGVRIIDYKTGKPPRTDWQTNGATPGQKISLHFNRQQLLFYKLLADQAHYKTTTLHVDSAELHYLEPHPENGAQVQLVIDNFDSDELNRLSKLIAVIWQHIQSLDFPDTTTYQQDIKGILRFEDDLIDGDI